MPASPKQQKKLVRLISALSDISESVRAADFLGEDTPEPLWQHLFVSMVVAYGRPFTENYGVGRIECDYPNYPDFGDSDMPRRHSQLLDLRNKFLAHSSAEGTRVIVFSPGVLNPLAKKPRAGFDFNIGKRVFPDANFVKWLRAALLPTRMRPEI
jgi:hypothetical protein